MGMDEVISGLHFHPTTTHGAKGNGEGVEETREHSWIQEPHGGEADGGGVGYRHLLPGPVRPDPDFLPTLRE